MSLLKRCRRRRDEERGLRLFRSLISSRLPQLLLRLPTIEEVAGGCRTLPPKRALSRCKEPLAHAQKVSLFFGIAFFWCFKLPCTARQWPRRSTEVELLNRDEAATSTILPPALSPTQTLSPQLSRRSPTLFLLLSHSLLLSRFLMRDRKTQLEREARRCLASKNCEGESLSCSSSRRSRRRRQRRRRQGKPSGCTHARRQDKR